jgi:hypothetical protein
MFYCVFPNRPAGVVRGIGMTQDVRGETMENTMRVTVGSFSNFGLPSTKPGKTNGVLVEGDFVLRLRTVFSNVCEISRSLKKFFPNRDKIEDEKNLHSL